MCLGSYYGAFEFVDTTIKVWQTSLTYRTGGGMAYQFVFGHLYSFYVRYSRRI